MDVIHFGSHCHYCYYYYTLIAMFVDKVLSLCWERKETMFARKFVGNLGRNKGAHEYRRMYTATYMCITLGPKDRYKL